MSAMPDKWYTPFAQDIFPSHEQSDPAVGMISSSGAIYTTGERVIACILARWEFAPLGTLFPNANS